MKPSLRNQPLRSALWQIATRVEKLAAFHVWGFSPVPFADLASPPGRVGAALGVLERWSQRMILAPTAVVHRVKEGMVLLKQGSAFRRSDNPLKGLKNTEFHLEAPAAGSVKLAADFTDWEKSPLDMIQSEDGVWFTIVPLLPGSYAYRFIVDGHWCEDPQTVQRAASPFGTTNAVVNVT
jgi:hypothetical protein